MYTLNAPYKEKPFLHVGGVNWNVLNAEASATSEPAFFLFLCVYLPMVTLLFLDLDRYVKVDGA